MKTKPVSDEELLQEMQAALTNYPNLSLSQIRTIVKGRSSRIAKAYHSLVTPEENKRRKTFVKAQRQQKYLEENLLKGLNDYVNNIELSLEEVAKQIKIRPATLSQYIKQELGEKKFSKISAIKRSYQRHLLNPKTRVVSPRPNTKKYVDPKGYVLVPTPCWMKRENKYSYEHQVVMLEALKMDSLPKGWIVHHINEDKTDNRLDNLALMTQQGHTAHHQGNSHPLSKLTMWEYEEFMTWKSRQTTAT